MKHINRLGKVILFVTVALVAFVLFSGIGSPKTNAAEDPAINPGTNPNYNAVISKDTSGNTTLKHETYLSADNQSGETSKANYASVYPAPGIDNSSIIDQNQYKNLTLHVSFTNVSTSDQTVNEGVTLPRFNNGNNNVSYAGSGAVQPNANSYTDGMDIGYSFVNGDYQPASSFGPSTDWSKLLALQVKGTLPAGKTFSLDIGLKAGGFTDPKSLMSFDISDSDYTSGTTINEYATFGTKGNVGDHIIAATKNADGSYTLIPELQKFMPTTYSNMNNSTGAITEKTPTYWNDGAELPSGDYYSTDTRTIAPEKIVAQDGTTKLIDIIHQMGYSFNIATDGSDQAQYAECQYPVTNPITNIYMPDGKTLIQHGKSTYNDQTLDFRYLEFHKMIDASDQTITAGSSFDPLANTTFLDKSYNKVKLPNPDVTYTIQKVDAAGKKTNVKAVDTTYGGVYEITYSDKVSPKLTVTKTVKVTVTAKNPTPNNNGGGSSSITTPTTSNTNTNNNNSGNNQVTNGNSNNGTSITYPAVPNYAAKEGAAVYAIKGIYMYKNANFKKSQRINKYPKAKRVNRPMFVVTDYARSKGGALRYKVRDVKTHKVGYITANRKYVVNVYYQTMPKSKKITVINPKGVYSYKTRSLTGRTKAYKKGTHLTVKKLVKHNLTTRYQLTNGKYVTANKKLIIQGNY